MKIAIFPGTFDPFTKGHADIVRRGLRIFDKVIVAVGINEHKVSSATVEQRLADIAHCFQGETNVEVVAYDGLTADFARQHGVDFILRGVRSLKDYEYERDIADINFRLNSIETIILFSKPELAAVSSSVVRELQHFGKDISDFLP